MTLEQINTAEANMSVSDYNHYPQVITIATSGHSFWSSPIEAFFALANVDLAILKSSKIHVNSDMRLSITRCLEVLGVGAKQVVTGTVAADTLYAPEMRLAASLTSKQLYWLRHAVVSVDQHASEQESKPKSSPRRRSIVYAPCQPGDNKCAFVNEETIKNTLTSLAKLFDVDFIYHVNMDKQAFYFNEKMKDGIILVAPHHASESVVSPFLAADLCFIELMTQSHRDDRNHLLTFARFAYLMGQDYIGVGVAEERPLTADVKKLAWAVSTALMRQSGGGEGGGGVIPHPASVHQTSWKFLSDISPSVVIFLLICTCFISLISIAGCIYCLI
jgi:hypothetical protein